MLPEKYTGESKQIGPRVHPDLWEDFKADAEQHHGKEGMASRELEKAMFKHMTDGDGDQNQGDRERLDVVNAKLDSLLVAVSQSTD